MLSATRLASQPPRTSSDSRPVVLVADDVPENRQLFSLYLRARYEVATASTAEDALDMIRTQSFDAALLDINYGRGMDGFDIIRAVRADPATRGLPTAALTAHVAPEDRDQCLKAGFDVFLAKPVRRAEMTDTLDRLLAIKTSPWVSRAA